jgi:hypothetical protein
MTKGGGPNGCRTLVAKVVVTMGDGSVHSADTSTPQDWEARTGPVVWDHFFHGESYDGTVPMDWAGHSRAGSGAGGTWAPSVEMSPSATAPTGMQVMGPDNKTAVALGELRASLSPPLRVIQELPALHVTPAAARDVGATAYVFDFGKNIAGMVRLSLPAGHTVPRGTVLRIEHGEVLQGEARDIEGMCKLCPGCSSCKAIQSCDSRGAGAVCDTYCNNPALGGGADDHPLRMEPCFPHQSYTPGYPAHGIAAHATPDRYIGDFNNANMTNLYTVSGVSTGASAGADEETYTAYFAAAGFRYAQLSGLPAGVVPTIATLTALVVHSAVPSAAELVLPETLSGSTFGTPNLLQRIHDMTRASQVGNLWSIPTDCPQRERRG